MPIDSEPKRASAAAAGTWLTRVLRPTGTVDTADRVFIVREYTGLTYEAAAAGDIPTHNPNTRVRPGYAPFTFPPKRFPPNYVKTR